MTAKIFSTIFLIVFGAAAAAAQLNPEQQILDARDEFFKIKIRSVELERVKREAAKPSVNADFTVNFPAIKEDFERIQQLNEEVFKLNSMPAPLNYSAVLKSVTEINHRCVRLKSNLFASDAGDQKEAAKNQPTEAAQTLQTRLQSLDKSLISFTHNAIFQNINLVNSQDSLKAQNDLQTVIEVSSRIREETKKLAKNTSKNRQ